MTDQQQQVTCPADGCERTGPPQSIKGHYSGKSDTAHKGGWKTAETLLDRDTAEQQPADEQTDTATDNSSSEPSGDDPALDGPSPDKRDREEGGEDAPGPCPDCGGELIDYRETDREEFDGRTIDTPDDYYCSECGQGWNDE